MGECKPATIDLIVDGHRFGTRTWRSIPRVGDLILVAENTRTVRVKSVIWSETGLDAHYYDCWIQLICSSVKHVVKAPTKESPARKPKAKTTPTDAALAGGE
jgi:hypothetical protein